MRPNCILFLTLITLIAISGCGNYVSPREVSICSLQNKPSEHLNMSITTSGTLKVNREQILLENGGCTTRLENFNAKSNDTGKDITVSGKFKELSKNWYLNNQIISIVNYYAVDVQSK